jgi:hypothetical protein
MTLEEIEKYAAFRAWKVIYLIAVYGVQILTILIMIVTLADTSSGYSVYGWLCIPAIIIERIIFKVIWTISLYIIGVHDEK